MSYLLYYFQKYKKEQMVGMGREMNKLPPQAVKIFRISKIAKCCHLQAATQVLNTAH